MILEKWYDLNKDDPYPTLLKKNSLAKESNLSIRQVSYWFIKRRNNKIIKFNPNRLSMEQKKILKNYYLHKNTHPSISELKIISESACITRKKAAHWFSFERHRNKNKLESKDAVELSTN